MQRNSWLILGALCLCATPAAAQVVHCDDLQADKPGDAARAFECLEIAQSDLIAARDRIDALEARMGDLASLAARIDALETSAQSADASSVPALGDDPDTRAVVAYVSANEEKCPKGWEPFVAAQDRFILGAGGAYPVVGTLGGEAEVALSEAEMPQHMHRMAYISTTNTEWRDAHKGTRVPYFDIASSGSMIASDTNRRVEVKRHGSGVVPAGGDQAHNNIPPFIALYFCQPAG